MSTSGSPGDGPSADRDAARRDERARRAAAPGGDERTPDGVWASRLQRRRDKIAEEIARNRRGEYTVPTWVLTLALVLVVAGWLALVLLS